MQKPIMFIIKYLIIVIFAHITGFSLANSVYSLPTQLKPEYSIAHDPGKEQEMFYSAYIATVRIYRPYLCQFDFAIQININETTECVSNSNALNYEYSFTVQLDSKHIETSVIRNLAIKCPFINCSLSSFSIKHIHIDSNAQLRSENKIQCSIDNSTQWFKIIEHQYTVSEPITMKCKTFDSCKQSKSMIKQGLSNFQLKYSSADSSNYPSCSVERRLSDELTTNFEETIHSLNKVIPNVENRFEKVDRTEQLSIHVQNKVTDYNDYTNNNIYQPIVPITDIHQIRTNQLSFTEKDSGTNASHSLLQDDTNIGGLLNWNTLPDVKVVSSSNGETQFIVPASMSNRIPPGTRVRKNVKNLSAQEKGDFVEAVLKLKATLSPYNNSYTYYDQFVAWHQKTVAESTSSGIGIAHHSPAFLPWHRKMLLLFEDALCEVSAKNITVPFWDWTDPASTGAVFTDDFMGSGGVLEQGYAVVSGPFRKGIWQINIYSQMPGHSQRCPFPYLVRGLGDFSGNHYPVYLPTVAHVAQALTATHYDVPPYNKQSPLAQSFRNTIEGFDPPDQKIQHLHNVVHDWVAGIFILNDKIWEGSMEPLDVSPNDPVFFLNHANIDRLWSEWEKNHPNEYAPVIDEHYGINRGDKMIPFVHYLNHTRMKRHGVTPGSMLEILSLGYIYE
ncbi:unnamed protein product [Didymodactylos carnosus]|uniref:Tyrosinase copper-binding domain-containing protein n=1 Tax=Didymodactylos carnosus TaxID=1234261 RepID=A0A814MII4_9BILA|nr:unnamed protein product [Didymodactylos carnosus]CAF3846053.1 unnamed protein product [Didymodactylos carnosus]